MSRCLACDYDFVVHLCRRYLYLCLSDLSCMFLTLWIAAPVAAPTFSRSPLLSSLDYYRTPSHCHVI